MYILVRAVLLTLQYIDLPVKHTLGADVLAEVPNYNLYVRVAGMQPTTVEGDLYTTLVQLEVKTIKEGRIREKLFLKNSKEENMEVSTIIKEMLKSCMKILVTAQVMESGQGNPLLKNGVHLISHEVEDESEWPGHSSH